MLTKLNPVPQTSAQALVCSTALLSGQGWGLECSSRATETIRLGGVEASIQRRHLVEDPDGVRISAPPRVVQSIGPNAFSSGTKLELELRLLVIAMLSVLARDDGSVPTLRGALEFVEQFGGTDALPGDLRQVRRVLIDDFIAWRDVGRDLPTWFKKRFVWSRIFAI